MKFVKRIFVFGLGVLNLARSFDTSHVHLFADGK